MYLTQRGARNVSLEGSDNPHRRLCRERAATPYVSCDYQFSVAGDDGGDNSNLVTSTVMTDIETTYATVAVVPNKGPDTFPSIFGIQFMQELGCPIMVLKTDCEPSIIAWAAAVQREWAKEDTEQRQQLILRQSLRG